MKPIASQTTLRIFDFPVVNVTIRDAVQLITQRVHEQTFSPVLFINAHCVNIAYKEATYANILRTNSLNFCDGVGVAIAARFFGERLVDNVNGTDLFPPLCERLASQKARIFLLGGEPGVADLLSERMATDYPGIQVVGSHHGHFTDADSELVANQVQRAKPDVLFVAMGVPKQELWIAHWGRTSGASVALAVGGLFNFYAGKIPRAPLWMRRLKLEWLHRLAQEPRRMWRRYLVGNLTFLIRMLCFSLNKLRGGS